MNEFIVWDIDNYIGSDNQFHTPMDLSLDGLYLQIIDDGKLVLTDICDDGEYTSPIQIKIETFNYIGKTDINGDKIYADSSIVEFIADTEDKYIIRWNSERLNYSLYSCSGTYIQDFYQCENFKLVGTLQDNPELFYKQ